MVKGSIFWFQIRLTFLVADRTARWQKQEILRYSILALVRLEARPPPSGNSRVASYIPL